MNLLGLVSSLLLLLSACTTQVEKSKKMVQIQFVRNATLTLDYAGKKFLVDPSLSPKHSFMSFVEPDKNLNPTVDLPLSVEDIVRDVDAILLTHAHLDHFDEAAKTQIDTQLPLFGQPHDAKMLEESAFEAVTIIEDRVEYESVSITRTGGKHGPEALLEMLGEVSGFVLQAEQHPTIYIVGDCLWDEEIKATIDRYQPDIIILNSGGAQIGGATILMDEAQVVALAKHAPDATLVAVHMEALDHCQTTRESLRAAADEAGIKVRIPEDGARLTL